MKGARRMFGRSGYRLTVRYGRIYTICATEQRQPNTAAQREARATFAEANRRAISELQSEARREYWTEKARQRGYKTAIGACRAYHIGMVREEHEARKVSAETVTRNATATAKRGRLRRYVHNVAATMRREERAARIWATPKRSTCAAEIRNMLHKRPGTRTHNDTDNAGKQHQTRDEKHCPTAVKEIYTH